MAQKGTRGEAAHPGQAGADLSASAAIYARKALAQIPRLLATLDREPASLGYGNFDRDLWAWKFRDCPVTMFQTGIVPLALVWSHPLPGNSWHRSERLLEWIVGALDRLRQMQNDDGSFNVWGPNTRNPGVSLALALVACKALRALEPALDARLAAALRQMIEGACDFGLAYEEDYAFISNHQAHFALAFLSAGELLDRTAYRQRSEQIIQRILAEQSPDGWYAEYGGPDPGYESLGISYLASYWQRTRSEPLLDSLRRCVGFYSHCVHPDGSVGGVYGSRHTQQYFPAGLELLASEIPLAASVARFFRERLERGNVVTLDCVDAENFAVLLGNYLEASLIPEVALPVPLPPMPCASLDGVRHFRTSGIAMAGTPAYYAVVNAWKGGVCRVFDKRSEKLAYEDAGYLVTAGGRKWTSQRLSASLTEPVQSPNEVHSDVPFTELRPEAMSPLRFVLFRLACLTIFRNARLGAWLQRQVVTRLITSSRPGALRMIRRMEFGAEEIRFSDRIEMEGPVEVDEVKIERSFTAIHMGSAKYFHSAELETTPLPDVRGLAGELAAGRRAICEFRLRFSAATKPELLTGAGAKLAAAAQPEGTLTRP